jgi:VCBS repeat-containing protein
MLGVVTEGEAASAVTGGQLVINDPDTGEAAFAALRDGVLDGTYGRFGFDAATGGWSYALDNDSATVKALVHGEVRTDTLVIESVDGTASASVVVTIQGRNSAAEISGDRAGFVVAGGGASTAGMMRITDPDAGEDGFARPDAAALRGDFGAFDFDPGTGAWAYTLAHDGAALRALPAGGEATESLVVTSLDGTASETIHVTVRGVNDAATITGDAIGLVRADDIDARIATGVIHITDPDAGEDGFARPDAAALRGDFGAFDFDPGTGAWAYTLAHDGAAVLDMAGGAEGVDTLRVTSLDGTASREIAVIVQPPGHVPPPLPDPAPALAIREIARDGPTMTFGISVDPKAVAGPVLRTLDFTLGYDPALVAHVPESGSAAFTGGAGTLVLSQSGIAAADLGAPVATFAMTLLPAAGPRTIRFELTDVAVNGAPMTDQTGADAPAFGIASAFHNLTGVIDLRAAGADAPGPEGTAVRFVEADGTTRETVTDAQGAFSFLIHDGTTGILELARAHAPAPTGPDKAPGMADMLALFRMVPGLDVQGDDLIAGDVTRDGTTDLADVLALFRHVAGVPGAPEPRYVFVDAEDDLRGIDAANVPLPEDGFAVGPVTGDTHMSFLGILGGDLRDHL